MENKTCGNCKYFPGMGKYCPIIVRFCDPNNEKPCEFFEETLVYKITMMDKTLVTPVERLKEVGK